MTTTNRIRDKIAALLQKTVANGCTQHEADAARVMVEKLMTKYGVTQADVAPRTVNDVFRDAMREERVRRAREYAAQAAAGKVCSCPSFLLQFFVGSERVRKGPHHAAGCGLHEATQWQGPLPNEDTPQRKAEQAKRGRRSHKYCTHEATPAARARCRREQGK